MIASTCSATEVSQQENRTTPSVQQLHATPYPVVGEKRSRTSSLDEGCQPLLTSSPCKLKQKRREIGPSKWYEKAQIKAKEMDQKAHKEEDVFSWFVTSSQSNHFLDTVEEFGTGSGSAVAALFEHIETNMKSLRYNSDRNTPMAPLPLNSVLFDAALDEIESEYNEEKSAIDQEFRRLEKIRDELTTNWADIQVDEMHDFEDTVVSAVNREIKNFDNVQKKLSKHGNESLPMV